jgi:phage FluMu protein Com
MQIRCYRCNWSFAISNEEIAFVLEALEESGDSHYDARCPRCRRTTKMPIEQLRRAMPRVAAESPPEEEKVPETEAEKEEEGTSKEES